MPVTITVRDETAAGESYHETALVFPVEQITVRDLIRERVYQEVQDFNRQRGEQHFRGLVQPSETERVLNGRQIEYRLKQQRSIDWKEQFERAQQAFEALGFLLLIDNRQAESLDEQVTISPDSNIAFVKLTPLVGG